jgi:hypothetical protein
VQDYSLLHQCGGQSAVGGFYAFHRWRQLLVVAAHHYAVRPEQSGPAGGLQGLGGFVDEEGAEASAVHDVVGRANEGAADHACLLEEVGIDFDFQLGLPIAKPMGLLALGAFAQGAAYAPQLVVVGM